jgi:hypothetical protein
MHYVPAQFLHNLRASTRSHQIGSGLQQFAHILSRLNGA